MFFAVYLQPLRSNFATTMTDSERAIMMEHVQYWTQLMSQGKVYAFGPVMDPNKIYGLGIVSVDDESELKEFIEKDPAGKINKYEYYPMNAVVPKIVVD